MSNTIRDTIINNPDFDICINLNLEIKSEYLKEMSYPYPYDKFSVDLLGEEYGKVYNNSNEEFKYSIDEFQQYFDIEINGDLILKIDITNILQDPNNRDMYYNLNEIIKCKLTLQDIGYSDRLIYLEAEII